MTCSSSPFASIDAAKRFPSRVIMSERITPRTSTRTEFRILSLDFTFPGIDLGCVNGLPQSFPPYQVTTLIESPQRRGCYPPCLLCDYDECLVGYGDRIIPRQAHFHISVKDAVYVANSDVIYGQSSSLLTDEPNFFREVRESYTPLHEFSLVYPPNYNGNTAFPDIDPDRCAVGDTSYGKYDVINNVVLIHQLFPFAFPQPIWMIPSGEYFQGSDRCVVENNIPEFRRTQPTLFFPDALHTFRAACCECITITESEEKEIEFIDSGACAVDCCIAHDPQCDPPRKLSTAWHNPPTESISGHSIIKGRRLITHNSVSNVLSIYTQDPLGELIERNKAYLSWEVRGRDCSAGGLHGFYGSSTGTGWVTIKVNGELKTFGTKECPEVKGALPDPSPPFIHPLDPATNIFDPEDPEPERGSYQHTSPYTPCHIETYRFRFSVTYDLHVKLGIANFALVSVTFTEDTQCFSNGPAQWLEEHFPDIQLKLRTAVDAFYPAFPFVKVGVGALWTVELIHCC